MTYEITGLTLAQARDLADELCGMAVWHQGHAWINEGCVARPKGCHCPHCQILDRGTEQREPKP